MTTSTRTPEGSPNECSVCGNRVIIDPTLDTGDAPCPQCGCLLWFSITESGESTDLIPIYANLRKAVYSSPIRLPDDLYISPRAIDCMPESVARENVVVPVRKAATGLIVAFSDPLHWEVYDRVSFVLNSRIAVVYAERFWILNKINECYRKSV